MRTGNGNKIYYIQTYMVLYTNGLGVDTSSECSQVAEIPGVC